jgi:hypothetical protein
MTPNSALSAWQLAIIAVVAVATLAVWIIAVFLAAREPRERAQAAVSHTEVAATGTGADLAAVAEQGEPRQSAGGRMAA